MYLVKREEGYTRVVCPSFVPVKNVKEGGPYQAPHTVILPTSFYIVLVHSYRLSNTMSPIPPAAIALFSMFLYNCINALFAYLTNIMQMSMLQLVTIQAVSLSASIYLRSSHCRYQAFPFVAYTPS